MSEVEAYRQVRDHVQHSWTLIAQDYDWCPECGATRPTPKEDQC